MTKEKVKELLKLGLPIVLGTILILGVSYAWLTLTITGTKTNTLKIGTLLLELDDTMGTGISLTDSVPMYDQVGVTKTPYKFTLENQGTIPSEYTIYLDDLTLKTGEVKLPDSVIKYNLLRDGEIVNTAFLTSTGTNPNRVLDTGVIEAGDKYTYELRLWLDQSMTNADMNKTFRGQIRVEASQVIATVPANSNILAVYKYDQTNTATKCITGEESTCVELTTSKATTYEKGTIIHYQVNANESYYFYVLHDDGKTLTMQQREDTTSSVWYTSSNTAQGPLTAIEALESETANWSNVNVQTYTMGSTVFGNNSNAFTGCSAYNSCTTNAYTWSSRTAKSRMITVQEALEQGCTSAVQSCPIYMYNYLSQSSSVGGTVNGSMPFYWTMSVISGGTGYTWGVVYNGRLTGGDVSTTLGVRAVVVVNK